MPLFAYRTLLHACLGALLAASLSFAENSVPQRKSTTKPAAKSVTFHKKSKKVRRHRKPRGQAAIDGDRAREIQEALIRVHYLSGKPTGKWDAATQSAMRRYQADQGWQSKSVPDSRALIRLGLGPDKDRLLNPESAMTTGPAPQAAMQDPAGSVTHTANATSTMTVNSPSPADPPASLPEPAPSR